VYGPAAGVLTLIPYTPPPTVLAHATLTTTDLYAALTTTAAMYAHWRLAREPGVRWAVLAGTVLGLALPSRFTGALLVGIAPACPLGVAIGAAANQGRSETLRDLGFDRAVALNASLQFRRVFVPLRDYQFSSTEFKALQAVPLVGAIRLRLPHPLSMGWTF
jgi:hypothetical protein